MSKILIVVLLVVGVAIFFTLRQGKEYREFMEKAEKGNAIIVRKEERIAEPKTKRKEYWVTYRYSGKDGSTHTNQEFVEYEDIFRGLHEGQASAIYYSRDNPSQSYLASVIERRLGIANALGK